MNWRCVLPPLMAIAKKALARKTGARGLRSILEQSLLSVMFDLPTMHNVAKVVVEEPPLPRAKHRCWSTTRRPSRLNRLWFTSLEQVRPRGATAHGLLG